MQRETPIVKRRNSGESAEIVFSKSPIFLDTQQFCLDMKKILHQLKSLINEFNEFNYCPDSISFQPEIISINRHIFNYEKSVEIEKRGGRWWVNAVKRGNNGAAYTCLLKWRLRV